MTHKQYLTATEAAAELGISRATLYAYVSRGMIHSEPVAGNKRARRYRSEDVHRLKARNEQRQNPAAAARQALHFGAPVLESKITLIEGGRFFYRGYDALRLATTREVEEVATLIWTGRWTPPINPNGSLVLPKYLQALLSGETKMTAVERFQAMLPFAAAEDPAAYDLRPDPVRDSGARILRLLTGVASGVTLVEAGVVTTLQKGWNRTDDGAGRLLNAALVLCADHELNVSSFTARCAASARSTPYQVVLAGLAALQGTRHGGHAARVAAFLNEVQTPEQARATLAARLRRGERIPGFGHPLYPHGDPRARLLLRLTREAYPASSAVNLAEAVVQAAGELVNDYPTLDFGLATVASAMALSPDAPLTLFALGRTIGWIGHAIEQYEAGQMIRPRARYVGPLPDVDDT